MNFTRHDYETILYSLEGYIQGNDDDKLCDELVDICYRIERKLRDEDIIDSQQLEGDISTVRDSDYIKCESNNKNNATYNEVDYVEQCITEGNDYRDCVDTLVDKMKGVNDDYYRIDGY